jgi:Rubredoxin-like zinc ribbon domain (DUF35_N)
MKQGVAIWRCAGCRTAFFPQRLLCPRCHGDAFAQERVYEAVVEEVSTIRHMLGQTDLAAAAHCQRTNSRWCLHHRRPHR